MPRIIQNGIDYSVGGTVSEVREFEVDTELNTTSENPIQNKAVTKALNDKLNVSDIVFATKQDIDELFSMQ